MPASANSLATSLILRMFSSRSSGVNPRFLFKPVVGRGEGGEGRLGVETEETAASVTASYRSSQCHPTPSLPPSLIPPLTSPDIVSIQTVGGDSPLAEVLLKGKADGGLAGSREASEPDTAAPEPSPLTYDLPTLAPCHHSRLEGDICRLHNVLMRGK